LINYGVGSRDNKEVQYSFENDQFEIKIISDNRLFSVPLRKEIRKQLGKIKNEEERIIQGKNCVFLIRSYDGYYYEARDSIAVNDVEGYLFYLK
jgi:hypothetical protein